MGELPALSCEERGNQNARCWFAGYTGRTSNFENSASLDSFTCGSCGETLFGHWAKEPISRLGSFGSTAFVDFPSQHSLHGTLSLAPGHDRLSRAPILYRLKEAT